jgi:hypothetical protein
LEAINKVWEQPVLLERSVNTEINKSVPDGIEKFEDQAREVVERSVLLIGEQGYCLWTCKNLSGSVICVVDDSTPPVARLFDDPGMKKRVAMTQYPVYTLDELSMLAQANDWTQRMVLEAKLCTEAVVIEVHSNSERVQLTDETNEEAWV